MTAKQNLFEEFKPLSKQEWIDKVQKDLKGKPLDDLKWQLGEDLTLDPFYHKNDQVGQAKINHGNRLNNDWTIGEDFLVDDPILTNKKVLAALENGVNAPHFIFNEVPSVETFQKLFKAVIPTYIETHFSLHPSDHLSHSLLLKNYHQYLQEAQIESAILKGSLRTISVTKQLPTELAQFIALFPAFKHLCMDYQQLTTDPAEIINSLTTILKDIDELFQKIEKNQTNTISITLSLGTSYFVAIAKIRALKILWENILQAYGCESIPLPIDATISSQAYDENTNTNMIRSMTIAMSAVIGGVDRLTIRPSDSQDSSATRIARNIQHLLKMESYLNRVIDPAAGSFYIEKLTKLFVKKTWNNFVHQ